MDSISEIISPILVDVSLIRFIAAIIVFISSRLLSAWLAYCCAFTKDSSALSALFSMATVIFAIVSCRSCTVCDCSVAPSASDCAAVARSPEPTDTWFEASPIASNVSVICTFRSCIASCNFLKSPVYLSATLDFVE